MQVIITDDEQPARNRLRLMLSHIPGIAIVAEATNGDEAIALVAEHQPDALFIDVEMPGGNGLDAVRQMQQTWCPPVVFTTAHTHPAAEAFDLDAADYLLKPYTRTRLLAAVRRLREHAPLTAPAAPPNPAPRDRFLIRHGKTYQVVPSHEIISVKSAANYVVIQTAQQKHILRRTLQHFASELCASRFCRTSRSTIVNLEAVREIRTSSSGHTHHLLLSDGSELPLTSGLRDFETRLAAIN